MWRTFPTICGFVVCVGCSAPTTLSIPSYLPSVSEAASSTRTAQDDSDIKERRTEFLKALNEKHKELNQRGSQLLAKLAKEAAGNSNLSLGLGASGIASGIAASALLAASPANAVTAAVFTGLTTGVVAFQTKLGQEGYTRSAVARVYEEARGAMSLAHEQYITSRAKLERSFDDLDSEEWKTAAVEASEALGKYEGAVLFPGLPMGSAEKEELKKEIIQELKTTAVPP